MRRTRFHNVLSLTTERKRIKLKKHKAQREREQGRRDYRVGLMICVDLAELTPMEKALCDAIRARSPGPVEMSVVTQLHKLLTQLLWHDDAVTVHTMDMDEFTGDGRAQRKVG